MTADIVFLIRAAKLEGSALENLRRELRAISSPGRQLILDLTGVEKANTRFACLILETAARLRERGGDLRLVGLRKSVAAFFELLRLHRSIEIQYAQSGAAALLEAA